MVKQEMHIEFCSGNPSKNKYLKGLKEIGE